MTLRLQAVEAFTPEGMASLPRDRGFALYPCRRSSWERMVAFAASIGAPVELSPHWAKRGEEFLYLWSERQQALAICGYFSQTFHMGTPPAPQPPLGLRDAFRQWRERRRKHDQARQAGAGLWEDGLNHSIRQDLEGQTGCDLRAWMPVLSALVSGTDQTKLHDVASTIKAHVGADRPLQVLEIGSGGCLLPLILRGMVAVERYSAIDLDFVMPFGFACASVELADGELALPNEEPGDAWLRFHSAARIPAFEPESMDVVVNVTSFQEMTPVQVAEYFALADRVLKPGGLLVCVNREAKRSRGVDMVFDAYPWPQAGYRTLVDDEARVSRLSRLDLPIRRRVLKKA